MWAARVTGLTVGASGKTSTMWGRRRDAMRSHSGSLRLFRLFGIPVLVHWTWFCFPFAPLLLVGRGLGGWAGVGVAFGILCLIVGCLLAHELAHCLVARGFGCRTKRILLIPFGMVGDLERIPREPAQEILVAAAGPVTSACLAGLAWAASQLANYFGPPIALHLEGLCYLLVIFNSMAAAFNVLVAILPSDGGRILRATLFAVLRRWTRLGERRSHLLATKIAVRCVGWPLAALLIGVMIKTGFMVPHLFILLPLLGVAGELELWALRECPEIFDVPDTVSFLPTVQRSPARRPSSRPPPQSLWALEIVLSSEQGARWVT